MPGRGIHFWRCFLFAALRLEAADHCDDDGYGSSPFEGGRGKKEKKEDDGGTQIPGLKLLDAGLSSFWKICFIRVWIVCSCLTALFLFFNCVNPVPFSPSEL